MYIKSLLPSNADFTWRVVAICDNRQVCDVDIFLSNLPSNMQKYGKGMRQLLAYVGQQGPQFLSSDLCHTIAEDIWQFRKGDIRVVWFYDNGKMVVCCHASVKKGQKTPKSVIDHATNCLRDYRLAKARQAVQEL